MAKASEARPWARAALRGIGDSLYTPFSGVDGEDIDWDAWVQAIERGRVLNALGEQQQRADANRSPQNDERGNTPRFACCRLAVQTGRDHEYHSLTRRKSSVQKNKARSDAGNLPRRTPARTLIK